MFTLCNFPPVKLSSTILAIFLFVKIIFQYLSIQLRKFHPKFFEKIKSVIFHKLMKQSEISNVFILHIFHSTLLMKMVSSNDIILSHSNSKYNMTPTRYLFSSLCDQNSNECRKKNTKIDFLLPNRSSISKHTTSCKRMNMFTKMRLIFDSSFAEWLTTTNHPRKYKMSFPIFDASSSSTFLQFRENHSYQKT